MFAKQMVSLSKIEPRRCDNCAARKYGENAKKSLEMRRKSLRELHHFAVKEQIQGRLSQGTCTI